MTPWRAPRKQDASLEKSSELEEHSKEHTDLEGIRSRMMVCCVVGVD